MKNSTPSPRRWARSLGLGAALLALGFAVHATPVVDGLLDADYGAPLATSAKDNLLVANDPNTGLPLINDNTDPMAKPMDATNLYVSNSGNALFLYVQLPYFTFGTPTAGPIGGWMFTMHFGGANDAKGFTGTPTEPYSAPITFGYAVGPNAVLRANWKSNKTGSDGRNGYANVVVVNPGNNGWQYNGADLFGADNGVNPPAGVALYTGGGGAQIAYKEANGATPGAIEIKLPYTEIVSRSGGVLVAPSVGETVKLQFIDTRYTDTGGTKSRGPVDDVPFEAASQGPTATPPGSTGTVTQYATYTIVSAITPMDVVNAGFLTDNSHLFVQFADNVGTGATTTSNYALTDIDNNNAVVPVTAAAIDANNLKQVDLTATLTPGHHYKVTVSNVQSTGNVVVTPGKNSAAFQAPVSATFTLTDNGGLIPPTKLPYIAFFTGASGLLQLTRVGSTNSYTTTTPVLIVPGRIEYKYVFTDDAPTNPAITEYDALNKRNHVATITAAGPNNFQDVIGGGPVNVTFNLTDYQDLIGTNSTATKMAYVTGDWNGFNVDPNNTPPQGPALLTKVPGSNPPVYTATVPLIQDVYTTTNNGGYKYVFIDPTATPPVDYDTLNANNRGITIVGSGNPLTQVQNDTVGFAPFDLATRALRIWGGLDTANQGDITNKDKVAPTGSIDILDVLKLIHRNMNTQDGWGGGRWTLRPGPSFSHRTCEVVGPSHALLTTAGPES